MYVKAAELKEQVVEWKASGIMSNRLGEMIQKIAIAVCNRYGHSWRTFPGVGREDVAQECVIRILKCRALIDPERNPFSYITRICRRLITTELLAEELGYIRQRKWMMKEKRKNTSSGNRKGLSKGGT